MSNETTLPPGVRRETNVIGADDINSIITGVAKPIIDLLNEYSKQHGATAPLFGCLYAAGIALACYDLGRDKVRAWMQIADQRAIEVAELNVELGRLRALAASPTAQAEPFGMVHACANDWFTSLPEGRQAVLREDKWMLAHAAFDAGRSAGAAPVAEGDALPDRAGIYAWSVGPSAALVLVDKRPSTHAPGGQFNGHVINSTKFYDGCAVKDWACGKWTLLHDFDAARAQASEGGAA